MWVVCRSLKSRFRYAKAAGDLQRIAAEPAARWRWRPAFPNAPGDPSRVDTYSVTGPAWILNRLVQGGERFEAITLAAPGTVTLRLVGIRARFFQPENTSDRGSFHSNDPALNDIWNLGAYTLSLDQLPNRYRP